MVGQGGVIPRAMGGSPVSHDDREPGERTEVGMLSRPVLVDENARSDISQWKVRDRVAAGFVEEEHVLAVGDPFPGELDPEAPAQGLGEQKSFWERLRGEKAAQRHAAERPLLPRKTHGRAPLLRMAGQDAR